MWLREFPPFVRPTIVGTREPFVLRNSAQKDPERFENEWF